MGKLRCTYQEAHRAARKKLGADRRTHEWQYECWIDGRFQFKVTIPEAHGHATDLIPSGTLKAIVSQLRLSAQDFERRRDCPLDKAEYEALIREILEL